MSITKRYIEELKQMNLRHTNNENDESKIFGALEVDAVGKVVLADWAWITDDQKVEEAKRLCAALEDKMGVMPPSIHVKVAEKLDIGSTTYAKYRRGRNVIRHRHKRQAYRYVRESIVHYLNTGEFKLSEIPPELELLHEANAASRERYKVKKEEEVAATEKRLAGIEKRIKANNTQFKSWKTRTANACDTTMSKLQAAIADQQDQRVRLNKAISECVRMDKRIDFVDKAVTDRLNAQHELYMKAHNRLDGLAEANKLLLTKLETAATAAATAAATPWWKRWLRWASE